MTMKSTLIVLMTLLAALAADILVHDRLKTKSLIHDAVPPQVASIATAEPAAPTPVSLPSVSSPPASQQASLIDPQKASLVDQAAPSETASIGTAGPATPTPESLPPFSAAPPGSPETAPPPRMTASQEASLDAWIIKTYLGCWKPAGQPGDANRYVARVRLKFKPDGSLLKPAKLVNPPSDPTQKPQAKSVLQAVKACDPLPVPAEYRSFYEQWKTKTILFDPQVAAR
jgi:colicin import membrane protein